MGSLLLVMLLCAGSASAQVGDVWTEEPWALEGDIAVAPFDGSVLYRGPVDALDLHLSGSVVTGYTEYRATAAATPVVDPIYSTQDRDREVFRFENAELALAPTEGIPLLYASTRDHDGAIATWLEGEGAVAPERDSHLVYVGVGGDPGIGEGDEIRSPTIGTGRVAPGMQVETPDRTLSFDGLDQVVLEGTFSVFLYNMTVEVTSDDGALWENRTGEWTTEDGDRRRSFLRTLILTVTEGRLTLEAPDLLTAHSTRFDLDLEGGANTHGAKGVLGAGAEDILFEGGPLMLNGTGPLSLLGIEGPDGLAETSGLRLLEPDRFSINGGRPVAVSPASPSAGPAEAGLGPWLLVLLPLLLFGAVAVPQVRQAALGSVRNGRESRSDRWVQRGINAFHAGDLETAISAHRRATRWDGSNGVAWHHLALAQLEAGHPTEALATLETRSARRSVDPVDLLELEASAAHDLGDRERLRDAFRALNAVAPAMARSLAADLDLRTEDLGRDHPGPLDDPPGHGGALDGYA